MASYLYCVLRPAKAEALPPALRGVGGNEVRSLSSMPLRPLEAWVSTISGEELRTTGEGRAAQALVHNEVVNTALSTGRTPVPARFGVYFRDDDACVRTLIDHRPHLLRALERVADAVEISVLVVPQEGAPRKPGRPDWRNAGAGRLYLEEIRKHAEATERLRLIVSTEAERISEALGNFVRAERRSTDTRNIVSLAHLVSRDTLEHYRVAVAGLKISEKVRVVRSEVRAPYSFAELDESGTGHDSSSPNHDE